MRLMPVAVLSLVVASLSSLAFAGDIACTVTYRDAGAASVKVALTPRGSTAVTAATGCCAFVRPRPGTYTLMAQKFIGGTQVAAIREGVVVVAGAGAPVNIRLAMVPAVQFSPCIPLKLGNKWVYDEAVAGAHRTRSESVTGTKAVSGVKVPVVDVTWTGSSDVSKRYWRSEPDGFTMYGELQGTDMQTWLPWVNVPDYLPLLFKHATNYTVHHSNGAPDDSCKMEYQFAAFENVTVPAGTFNGCARLAVAMWKGGVDAGKMIVWFAKGVGIVKQTEIKPGKTVELKLQSYHIVP